MLHNILVRFDNGKEERWKISLIASGDIKRKKSAMALTVGTPTGIGA